MNQRQLPFWLFVFSLFVLLILRDLFREGVFMDGMLYISVGKNLADGLGTFWHPHFSQTVMMQFHEQPPLLFGIEALFFKLFGSSIYVERFYGLVVALATVSMFYLLWNNVLKNLPEKSLSWLPVLFWLCIPVCFWAYANNMEEPLMGLFDLGSVFFISRALIQHRSPYLNLSIAALLLIGASMSKGVQGLFPLTAVFFYWLTFRNMSFSKMVAFSFFLTGFVVFFYTIILFNDSVRSSYQMYLNTRILPTFLNPASTHTNRFYIIKELFSELLPVFILITISILLLLQKKKFIKAEPRVLKLSTWFFLIALSGSLPLLLTIEQSGFYLVTAMPYFTLGFALLLAPSLSKLIETVDTQTRNYRRWVLVTFCALGASLIFMAINISQGPKRDKELIHDLHLAGEIIKKGSVVNIAKEMYNDWSLQTYANRYFYLSLDISEKQHEFFLLDKSLDPKLVPEAYKILNLPTQKFSLYQKK